MPSSSGSFKLRIWKDLTPYHIIPTFSNPLGKKPHINIVGKGENAGNQHFMNQLYNNYRE